MSLPKPNQNSGAMSGHVQKGRVYMPPLAATGVLSLQNWMKDDFPDLLWPALVLAELGKEGFRWFVPWQKKVQDGLAHLGEAAWVAERLDGRLTNLASLVARFPEAEGIVVREAESRSLLSDGVRKALASYPYSPAPWLSGAVKVRTPEQPDLLLIRKALLLVLGEGHHEALIKCLRVWSTVQAGTFSSDERTIDLLKNYPTDRATRASADSAIRAMWGAHRAMIRSKTPSDFDGAVKWARAFWGTNSMTSACLRERDIASDGHSSDLDKAQEGTAVSSDRADPSKPLDGVDGGEHLRPLAMDVLSSFVEALERSPAHLYESERQEVTSGLVARAGRDLIAVLGAPDLWCLEHGAHIGRMLIEVRIYIAWMATQKHTIYKEFQDYGAGKAKLYSKILAEVPVENHSEQFGAGLDELKRLSHNDDILDHRVVDTRDTFAGGKSIRAMAEEAGLLDLYRQAYTVSSGVSHSEWWSVETHAMEPCLNVLHGMHRIPSLSLNAGGDIALARSWVDQFYSLVRTSLRVLGTDESAIEEAFGWLDEEPEADHVR